MHKSEVQRVYILLWTWIEGHSHVAVRSAAWTVIAYNIFLFKGNLVKLLKYMVSSNWAVHPRVKMYVNMIFKTFTYRLKPNNILTTPYFHVTIQAFLFKNNFHEMSGMFLIPKWWHIVYIFIYTYSTSKKIGHHLLIQ